MHPIRRIPPAPRRPSAAAALAPLAAAAALALPTLAPPALALPAPAAGPPAAPVAAEAAATPITLAEVNTQVDPAATHLPDLKDILRRSAEAELKAIDWGKEGLRRRYKVSAAVVQLQSGREGRLLRASCAVSAAVRDERGALLAIVEGRARAEEEGAAPASAERGALEGAVQGAIRRLPEAIRRAQ